MRIKITDLSSNYYRCDLCQQNLPASDFYKSYLHRKRLRCRACVSLQAECTDQAVYRRLLNTLRKSENKLYRFFAKKKDVVPQGQKSRLSLELVRSLFTIVWKGQSALRRCDDDTTSLVLVRWDIQQPFSRQNNIVLTVKQAARHYNEQLKNKNGRELLYGVAFCTTIQQLLQSAS